MMFSAVPHQPLLGRRLDGGGIPELGDDAGRAADHAEQARPHLVLALLDGVAGLALFENFFARRGIARRRGTAGKGEAQRRGDHEHHTSGHVRSPRTSLSVVPHRRQPKSRPSARSAAPACGVAPVGWSAPKFVSLMARRLVPLSPGRAIEAVPHQGSGPGFPRWFLPSTEYGSTIAC